MKIKNQTRLTTAVRAALLLTVSASSAYAAEETEVITVTANRVAQSIQETLTTVDVITRVEIEKIQPNSTIDLLKSISGLDFSYQGGLGQQSSIFVRGANSNHTLVLIDGQRIGSATLGTTEIQNISPSQIERIEIVKGPRAAIWGSDAIGGVIQIFTRGGETKGLSLSAKIGSDNYQELGASVGFNHGDGSSTITLNNKSSDGFDVIEVADEDDDGYDILTGSLSGQQNVSAQLVLDWTLSVSQKDADYDNKWGGADQLKTDNYAWTFGGEYNTNLELGKNTTGVSFGQSRDLSKNYMTGQPVSSGTSFETVRNQFSVINSTALSVSSSVSIGSDVIVEAIDTTTNFSIDDRTTLGIFAQYAAKIDQLSADVALRHDDVEGIDSETSYNLAAGYDVSNNIKVLFSHGTGFKAPTFNDLYYPGSGNPELDAEYSTANELSARYYNESISAEVSVYQSEVKNLIRWVADENYNYQPENVDTVNIEGVELNVNFRGDYADQKVSLGYNEALDDANDEQLIRRPQEHFSYVVSTQLDALSLYAEYVYKGKSYDIGYNESFQAVRFTLPSYSIVNVSANYEINDKLSLNARLSNLLDESYKTALDYNTPQSQWYFGVNYQL